MTKFGAKEATKVVNEYPKDFADHFNFTKHISLSTNATRVSFQRAKGWLLTLYDSAGYRDVQVARLVVASALESQPAMPHIPGMGRIQQTPLSYKGIDNAFEGT